MRRLVRYTMFAALVTPVLAEAHVGVRPRESKAGAEEHYTVRVPTEGSVTTDQMFADGTSADWVNPPGTAGGRPGPVTKLVPAGAAAPASAAQHPAGHTAPQGHPQAHADEAAHIAKWLDGYDAAFNAKDLEKLGTFYDPNVTIYEGGGIDNGWAAYRDKHLGPELKAFENLQFGHTDRKVHVLEGGRTAYVTSLYFIKAKMGERSVDGGGLETLVLIKGADGAWKIRHLHTSSRPRRPAGGGE